MQIISMKQLREHFEPIKKGLNKGTEYLLLYRSKPLAVISPYKNQAGKHFKTKNKTKKIVSQTTKTPTQEQAEKQTPPPIQTFKPKQEAPTLRPSVAELIDELNKLTADKVEAAHQVPKSEKPARIKKVSLNQLGIKRLLRAK